MKHQRQISILVDGDELRRFDARHGRGCRSEAISNLIAADNKVKEKKPTKKSTKKADEYVDPADMEIMK